MLRPSFALAFSAAIAMHFEVVNNTARHSHHHTHNEMHTIQSSLSACNDADAVLCVPILRLRARGLS